MTISIKPTASGSTIEQDGSTILTVDGSGNLSTPNNLTVSGAFSASSGGGKVLQLQSTRFTTQTTFSGTGTYAEINTGLRVTITPSSTSNKIILEAYIPYSGGSTSRVWNFVFYDVTGGNRVEAGASSGTYREEGLTAWRGEHYDVNDAGWIVLRQIVTAPRTSATTYTIYSRAEGSPTMYLNYSSYDGTVPFAWTGVSTVSAMEVSG